MEDTENTREEIVRIIKDGQIVDTWHGQHSDFAKRGYKQFERPFIAQFGYIEIDDIAEYTDERRN